MLFSLVIPCYNESENLPLIVDRCELLLIDQNVEIILVNNGSTDETRIILPGLIKNKPSFKIVTIEKNKGYGFGILSGLKAANGDLLGWTHADMQADPHDVLMGIDLFRKYGSEIFVKGLRQGRPFTDNLFTFGMSVFETLLLRKCLWDINAQPTMFSREFFLSWSSPPSDFSLDLFAYFQAKRLKKPVKRISVVFARRAFGHSSWNINWSSKKKFIIRTIKYSFTLRNKLDG